jgi:hypothetical protein
MAADPIFLAGERLPAGRLQKLGGEDTAYSSPIDAATTDPTIGAGGIQAGVYYRRGDLCFFQVNTIWGGAGLNAGVGAYSMPLPVDLQVPTGLNNTMVAKGWYYDTSAGVLGSVFLQHVSGDPANRARMLTTGATVGMGPTNPIAWAVGDTIIFEGWYQAVWP